MFSGGAAAIQDAGAWAATKQLTDLETGLNSRRLMTTTIAKLNAMPKRCKAPAGVWPRMHAHRGGGG